MMDKIAEELSKLPYFHGMRGAEASEIEAAEARLGVVFSDDFRQYLQTYALASANGHELTGLCKSDRLNVIEVTEAERDHYEGVDPSWYVIERIGIDGALAWQASDGSIYIATARSGGVKVCESLLEDMVR